MSPAAHVAVGAVRAYQWTVRPLIGANCRFLPSCSEYAVEAMRAHGAMRGAALAGWRILRCNPLCEGGYDPVPPCRHTIFASATSPPAVADDAGPGPSGLTSKTSAGSTGAHDDGKSL